jgi:hypothetical protein
MDAADPNLPDESGPQGPALSADQLRGDNYDGRLSS